MRHALAELLARRGQPAPVSDIQAEEGVQTPRARGLLAHASARPRPVRSDARAGPVEAYHGRELAQVNLAG